VAASLYPASRLAVPGSTLPGDPPEAHSKRLVERPPTVILAILTMSAQYPSLSWE